MRFLPVLLVFSLLTALAPVTAQSYLVNGDAEGNAGGDGYTVIPPTGWTTTGNLTTTQYATGWITGSMPPDAGANFFSGGVGGGTAEQTLDLSTLSAEIDAGALDFHLSAWLGGWQNHTDWATVTVRFEDALGGFLGQFTIGPVTAAERNNESKLLYREHADSVPAGARSAHVLLDSVLMQGSYSDGYADSIELHFVPDGGPVLRVSRLTAGQLGTASVSGGTPGSAARLAYSLTGGGPLNSPYGTLLLSAPYKVLVDLPLDGSGSGSLSRTVPAGLLGATIWFQALDLGSLRLSNGARQTVQ